MSDKDIQNKPCKKQTEPEELADSFYEDDENPKKRRHEKKPFSLVGNIIFIITIGILLLIGWAIYVTWQPQDTSNIPGFRDKTNAPDIPKILQQAINRDISVSFSEEDINRYLAAHIQANQHGPAAIFATNPAVGVRLHGGKIGDDGSVGDGYMEIILERYTGVDSRHTISLYMTATQTIDTNNYMSAMTRFEFFNDEPLPGGIAVGGAIGKLPVPQGYMRFLLPAYENLLDTCFPLIRMIEESGLGIHFEEGRVNFTPPQRKTL